MKYALLSDIHANKEALEAVLRRCEQLEIDEYFCLGDIVGYGASPSACVQIVKSFGFKHILQGNHDFAIANRQYGSSFNSAAKRAVDYTRNVLSDDERVWLSHLPFRADLDDFIIVHSNSFTPRSWDYPLVDKAICKMCLHTMRKDLCFVGHSHFWGTMTMLDGEVIIREDVDVIPPCKCIINVGSVGQPRDEDNRAGFAVYDSETRDIVIHRVEYDFETAANKIIDAGLPQWLAVRLELGK